jgi:hypothetical protein
VIPYISRAEYDKLKAEHEELKEEMAALKAQMKEVMKQRAPVQVQPTLKPITPTGQSVGDASATFTAKHGEHPFYDAEFNPLFVWKLGDKLLFESELEITLQNGDTHVELATAEMSYVLNDYMTIGAGKFLNPMNYFDERLHPQWINKLPDRPLAVHDGLLPESELGRQVRGVIPIGPTKLEYAAFVANAPDLVTTPSSPPDLSDVGTLDFDNFSNHGGHIAVGGRLGLLPIPGLGIGYGFQTASVGSGKSSVRALLQSVDFSYVRDSDLLKGLLNLHAQWVWSNVGRKVYDPDGSQGFGPLTFNNNRNGGYAQISYRPTKLANSFLRRLEPVFRFDILSKPEPRLDLTSADTRWDWIIGFFPSRLSRWRTSSMKKLALAGTRMPSCYKW